MKILSLVDFKNRILINLKQSKCHYGTMKLILSVILSDLNKID